MKPIRLRRHLIAAAALSAAAAVTFMIYSRSRAGSRPGEAAAVDDRFWTYVGSDTCASCHSAEADTWGRSQHAQAMAEARGSAVLGDFDSSRVRDGNGTSLFYRRGDDFYVKTDGPDGSVSDFRIKYTFGVFPLQQYLIELSAGRLQALSIAWDARPVRAGGQRWFHLYPGQLIKAGDPLHWSGLQQNWNFMCADCHSTNVRKGYVAATREYRTTWSEISVGCEACHGPGSAHVTWARGANPTSSASRTYLTAPLRNRKGVAWVFAPGAATASRNGPTSDHVESETCARCHGRRSQITDRVRAGDPMEDGFRSALLTSPLYYPDGQQRDEVYNYGSFLQSKMYAKGVTCSDCHDAHAAGPRRTGNAMCTFCHRGSKYEVPQHTLHETASVGSSCVACHMPTTRYMQIDERHDHSFRIPRPDRTISLGVPNACTASCHRDKTAQWAERIVERQLAHAPAGFQNFAEAFSQVDMGKPGALEDLTRLIRNDAVPAIVRASAFERLAASGLIADADVLGLGVRDVSPLVRRAALAALRRSDPATRLRLAPALLTDAIRTVRIEAAVCLANLPEDKLPPTFRAAFAEYVAEQEFNADRPEAQVNLGTVLAERGQMDRAIAAFREATVLDRTFIPAYVNWADVLRVRGEETEAERILRDGLKTSPASPHLHYALGLLLVRARRSTEALAELAQASRLGAEVARYSYVYAVALHDAGRKGEAMSALERSLKRHPFDRDTLLGLATYSFEAGNAKAARQHAAQLLAIQPGDPEVRALVERLK